MTDVVAALIWDNDKFLACQRPAHKKRPLLWEFVGGKTEPGESFEEALIRECREELGITVCPEHIFMQVIHAYPDITIRLTLFNAVISEGTPRLLEHNAMRWVSTSNLDPAEFCPADKDILAELKHVKNHLQAELFALRDLKYKSFSLSLLPGFPSENMLGVRMPVLRKLSKSIINVKQIGSLPYRYHEENLLYCILLNRESDFRTAISMLDAFLPHVNSWAVCDALSPICFNGAPAQLLEHVIRWLGSEHPYSIRFAINVLRKYYLGSNFSTKYLDWVADVKSEHYYVKMMVAWYFATALDCQFESSIQYLNKHKLNSWVHNKTIQKGIDSHRLSKEHKILLRTLKVREAK